MNQVAKRQPPQCLLSERERKQLRTLVENKGVASVARLLGVSRGVVIATAGGLNVRRGSLELVRTALNARRESK